MNKFTVSLVSSHFVNVNESDVSSLAIDVRLESLFAFHSDVRVACVVELADDISVSSWPFIRKTLKRFNSKDNNNEHIKTTAKKTTTK